MKSFNRFPLAFLSILFLFCISVASAQPRIQVDGYKGDFPFDPPSGTLVALGIAAFDASGDNIAFSLPFVDTFVVTRMGSSPATNGGVGVSHSFPNSNPIIVWVDISDQETFYLAGYDYVVRGTGYVDGTTITTNLGSFSIENRGDPIAKAVWEDPITGAKYSGSMAGKKLLNAAGLVTYEGLIVSSTSNTAVLDSSAPSEPGALDGAKIFIIEDGAAEGETVRIIDYLAGRIVVCGEDWNVIPSVGAKWQIIADSGSGSLNDGLIRGATTNTVTLNASASSIDGVYRDQIIRVVSGPGQEQVGIALSYDGSAKIVTIRGEWTVIPTAGSSGYEIWSIPIAPPTGGGAYVFSYFVEVFPDGPRVPHVTVGVSTDAFGVDIVALGETGPLDANGNGGTFDPLLPPGTYYFWRSRSGYGFTNPKIQVQP